MGSIIGEGEKGLILRFSYVTICYLLMWWPKFFFLSLFQILLPIYCIGGGQGALPEANDIGAKRGLPVPGSVRVKQLYPSTATVPRVT